MDVTFSEDVVGVAFGDAELGDQGGDGSCAVVVQELAHLKVIE